MEENKGCKPEVCDDMKKAKIELIEIKKNISKLENISERQNIEINELKTNQAESRVYVKQILESIDKLENKIFTYVGQLAAVIEKDDKESRKERDSNAERWINLIKWILGGTIIAIVAYLFGKG